MIYFANTTHSVPARGHGGFLYYMADKIEKVAVYIDGSNLYYKLKDLKVENTTEFSYKGLSDFLSRERQIVSIRYYVGVVKVKNDSIKASSMRQEQQRLFSNLEKQGICIKRGYLMESNGKFHEKGVDVKIATDMIIGAYENYYDTAILISSNTDLIPAIKHIKYLNKKIEYVGFSHAPSFGLQKNVDISRLLIREDIEKFIPSLGLIPRGSATEP